LCHRDHLTVEFVVHIALYDTNYKVFVIELSQMNRVTVNSFWSW